MVETRSDSEVIWYVRKWEVTRDQIEREFVVSTEYNTLSAAEGTAVGKAFKRYWLSIRPWFSEDKNWWLKVDVRNAWSAFRNGYKEAQNEH